MPQPFNYGSQLPNPTQMFGDAMSIVGTLEERDQVAKAQELARRSQEQWNQDLAQLRSDPSASAVVDFMAKRPEKSKEFQALFEARSEGERKNAMEKARNYYIASRKGETDLARSFLVDSLEAAKNSDDQDAIRQAEALLSLHDADPKSGEMTAAMVINSLPNGKEVMESIAKFDENRRTEQLQPSVIQKSQADARKAMAEANRAAVVSRYAESQEMVGLIDKGADVSAYLNDPSVSPIVKEMAIKTQRMKKLKDDKAKEKAELEIAELKRKADQSVRDVEANAQTSFGMIDNQLSTIDRLLANPQLDDVIGPLQGGEYYPTTFFSVINPFEWSSMDEEADAIADIGTVRSQQFIGNLMEAKERGATFGGLTKEEGQKLEDMITSLKTRQSEGQFRKNLAEIQRLLLKSRNNVAKRYGVEAPPPDTPNVIQTDDQGNVTPQSSDVINRMYEERRKRMNG